jgi:ArsR family transcriptional regulator
MGLGMRLGASPAFLTLGRVVAKRQLWTPRPHFYISRFMEIEDAVVALGALAQKSRLKVFRLLVREGQEGMAAGDIARALAVPNNTMSAHLAVLSRANLVQARREGRSVIYAVDLTGTRALLSFLVEDCCQGQPKICGPMIESTLAACGPEVAQRKHP